MFQNKLILQNISNVDGVIEWMNSEYLNCNRENLKLKLHQAIRSDLQFKNNLNNGVFIEHVLACINLDQKIKLLHYYCIV